MDWPELTILDVGHGNCTLVRDEEAVFVVDVPQRDKELRGALRAHGITEIDAVLISHGDEDHVGGVSALLADPEVAVHSLYVNSDPIRATKAWTAVRLAVRDAERRGAEMKVRTELTSTSEEEIQLPNLNVEVLAPSRDLALSGAGGKTLDGRPLTSNSMSVVLRFSDASTSGVLLAGDLDDVGLGELLGSDRDPRAEVLVYPHHGGRPGNADPKTFADALVTAVRPERVIFSHSRTGSAETPHPEVISGVRSGSAAARIACTQLSPACAATCPSQAQRYLSSMPARGASEESCCAGTLEFRFVDDGLKCDQLAGHEEWVRNHVATPMCIGGAAPVAT